MDPYPTLTPPPAPPSGPWAPPPGRPGPPGPWAAPGPAAREPFHRSRAAIALLAVFGPVILWCVVLGVAALASSTVAPDESCSDQPFFCGQSDQDRVLLVAVFAGIFAVPAGTLVSTLSLLVPWPSRRAVVLAVLTIEALLVLWLGIGVALHPPS